MQNKRPSVPSWGLCLIALALCASGCGIIRVEHQTVVKVAPRPVSAELSIEVTNPDGSRQWRTAQKIDYQYSEPKKEDK